MEREFFATDVDQAVQKAATTMGVPPGELRYRVLDGEFGQVLKPKMVAILVEVEEGQEEDSRPPAGPSREELAARSAGEEEWAVYLLEGILERMDIEAKTTVDHKGDNVILTVQFERDDLDTRRGACRELRGALQHLVNRAVSSGQDLKRRYIVDLGGTLESRREKIQELGKEVVESVRRLGKPVHIHLMDSQDRRILHTELVEDQSIETGSSGDAKFRVLTLSPRSGNESKGKKQG